MSESVSPSQQMVNGVRAMNSDSSDGREKVDGLVAVEAIETILKTLYAWSNGNKIEEVHLAVVWLAILDRNYLFLKLVDSFSVCSLRRN